MPSWKKLITSGSSAKLSALTVDNTVTATAFSGIFQGALSGSAQIKTEISGAFTSTSSSLASRVTSNESIVKGKTILSQSAQIKTQISGALGANASLIRSLTAVGISGSFTSTSSSLASRITTNKGLVSGSFNKGFEFEGKISGSSTSTGSFGRIEVTANTLAIGGTEIDKTVADNITDLDQELSTTSSPTFAGLTTTGDITARNYIVSSSVTYMTSSFSSGSTIFGDDSGDSHKFTGSLLVTGSFKVASGNAEFVGNVSGSSTSTGSFGSLFINGAKTQVGINTLTPAAKFEIKDDGVAPHAILRVRSLNSSPYSLQLTNDTYGTGETDGMYFYQSDDGTSHMGNAGTRVFKFSTDGKVAINSAETPTNTLDVTGTITATGNISGSSTSTGSFGRIETAGNINADGRIYENNSSVIDHATAMAIVFGG